MGWWHVSVWPCKQRGRRDDHIGQCIGWSDYCFNWWIAVKFCADVYGPWRMDPNYCGDLLAFLLMPPWCWHSCVKSLPTIWWTAMTFFAVGIQCPQKKSFHGGPFPWRQRNACRESAEIQPKVFLQLNDELSGVWHSLNNLYTNYDQIHLISWVWSTASQKRLVYFYLFICHMDAHELMSRQPANLPGVHNHNNCYIIQWRLK